MVICGQEFEFSLMNANDLDRFEDANERMQRRSAEEAEQFRRGGVRLGDHARAQARIAIKRYIRYTPEELAQRKEQAEAARKRQEALDKLPETLEALTAAQTDMDSLMVDQDYRLTLLELGVTDDETTA